MELSRALDDFLMAKAQEALAAGTISQYGWHLSRLVVWLRAEGVVGVGEVERGHLRRWGASLHAGWSVATVKCSVVAARAFFRWCHQEGLCGSDPAMTLKFPKVPLKVQKTVSPDQLADLLAVCDGSVKGVRDAALLSLLFDSGLRRQEVLCLTVGCLDFERGVVSVPRRKGGDAGWSVMGAGTMERLRVWLGVRRAAEGVEALFVQVGGGGRVGQALGAEGLKSLLARLADDAGLPRLGAHAFRRGWAVALVEAGAPSRVIQEAAGWSSEVQLRRYTQALDAQRLARQFSPVDRMGNGGSSKRVAEADEQLPLWAAWPDQSGP